MIRFYYVRRSLNIKRNSSFSDDGTGKNIKSSSSIHAKISTK